jgi:hypothetical protein
MARTHKLAREKTGRSVLGIIIIIVIGAVGGYIFALVSWWAYGQIQLFLHVDFPYAALYPVPLYYQIGWTVFGPILLLIASIRGPSRRKRMQER